MSTEDNSPTLPTATSHNSIPWQKKIAIVERYMALGNARLVAELEGVSYKIVSEWKASEWWPKLVEEIRASRRSTKAKAISDIVEKGLEAIADRLEHGDYVLNMKTGKVERRPVSLRDLNNMTNALIARQTQLEELADRMENKSQNVQDTLSILAKEFAKWSKIQANKREAVDVSVVEKD